MGLCVLRSPTQHGLFPPAPGRGKTRPRGQRVCDAWAGAQWIPGWAPLNVFICAKSMSIAVEKSLRKLNIKQCVCWKTWSLVPRLMVKAVALGLGFEFSNRQTF